MRIAFYVLALFFASPWSFAEAFKTDMQSSKPALTILETRSAARPFKMEWTRINGEGLGMGLVFLVHPFSSKGSLPTGLVMTLIELPATVVSVPVDVFANAARLRRRIYVKGTIRGRIIAAGGNAVPDYPVKSHSTSYTRQCGYFSQCNPRDETVNSFETHSDAAGVFNVPIDGFIDVGVRDYFEVRFEPRIDTTIHITLDKEGHISAVNSYGRNPWVGELEIDLSTKSWDPFGG
jgi:hypothetical protein